MCENKWRPIETAPKDGTPIWAYLDGGFQTSLVFYNGEWRHDVRVGIYFLPSYWMPLPAAPHQEKAG